MKIYRCTVSDDQDGTFLSWHFNKADAARHLRKALQKDTVEPTLSAVTVVDIPTDKAGLIAWLNLYFSTDNG